MNPLIVTTLSRESEIDSVKSFNDRFKNNFRIVTDMNISFGNVWKVESSDKSTVEWTKRFLRKFLEESDYDSLIKIDPDTKIQSLPTIPNDCDIAGDFRKSNMDWVWFGAYQFYTRESVQKILNDSLYTGYCIYQDIELAKSIIRLNLKAYNMSDVNGWCPDESPTELVSHLGRRPIERFPVGLMNFN